ncbi:MAG: VTT domain-containing protein [Desulfosalsimonadaceae bacterium]
MEHQTNPPTSDYYPAFRPELTALRSHVADTCINCPKCISGCAFLKEHGTPGTIAAAYDPADPLWLGLPFQCSLCGLCAAVCPVNLSPETMFLEMRREAVDRDFAPMASHKGILAYENRGVSRKYSWYSLPEGCHTVLFPGCTFSGTRMDTTIALYEHLKTTIPDLGIVLDCCCKPSHDLGRSDYFNEMFSEMRTWLVAHGVQTVMVVCPNCYKVFKTWGSGLSVISAYEFLSVQPVTETTSGNAMPGLERTVVSIHDPCVLRNEDAVHTAVRNLADISGFDVTEMARAKKKTVCCGEGGSAGCMAPEFSLKWGEVRQKEAGGRRLLTYCAGCANFLNKKIPTDHILDAIFFPEAVAGGTRKAARAPFTYLNRLRLKRYLKRHHPGTVTRERNFTPAPDKSGSRTGSLKKYLILALILATIAGIHFSGILRAFDAETLRRTVASWGILAPVAFILLYAIAPALFLPGLPITLAGGILFGPFWGVVYSITGATCGAGVAFLISRYMARGWIQARLTGPRWQALDRSVEKNGWKIVAFTRLIPLFPFNLLNYAFGLTSIRFLPYAVTSFVCMLPACIAFIVFSSSLPDIIKGHVSPGFIIGILLIGLVSLIPAMTRRFMPEKNNNLKL